MRRLASFAGVIGVALAIGSPFLLSGGDVFDSLRNVSSHVVLVLAAVALFSALAKAAKLQLLLQGLGQRISFFHTFSISLATDFAFLASPAGAAGYAVNIALLRRAGAPWSLATTVVGADQALDLLFFAVAVPVAVFCSLGPLADVLPEISLRAYVVMLIAFVLGLGVLWSGRRRVLSVVHTVIGKTPWLHSRQEHLQQFLGEMRTQMLALLRGNHWSNCAVLMFTAIQWLLRYGALWFVLSELGHRLPFGFVLVLQAVVLHLAQWTGIPAGGGGADLGLAAALAPWVTKSIMASVLLLWRFATLYFPLLIGLLSLVALFGSWRVATDLDHLPDDSAR
ncbi:MAG: hypothetical protein JWL63_1270 [Rhodocyclales bacterium]|nr:hypothetical protein [Rhodocyclales bacterium]